MVYISLDWLSLVGSLSIGEVLDKFGIRFTSDLCSFFENTHGLDEKVVIDINGIRFEISRSVFLGHIGTDLEIPLDEDGEPLTAENGASVVKGDLLSIVWERLKVDFSGSALRWLRDLGYDVDFLFQNENFLADHSRYHLTRTDLAIDFVNLCPNLLDDLIKHCMECKLRGIDRLDTGRPGGVTYRVISSGVGGSVVLGSNQSPLRLEFYDKKAEQKLGTPFAHPLPKAFVAQEPVLDIPDVDDICKTRIDSWTRCELRARQSSACNWAEKVLFSLYKPDRDSDFCTPYADTLANLASVILIVRDRFWIRGFDGVVLSCLAEAFSELLLRYIFIMRNYRSDKVDVPIDIKIGKWFGHYWGLILKLALYYGWDGLRSRLNESLKETYLSDKTSAHKWYSKLLSDIASMLVSKPDVANNYKIIVDQLIAIK